MPTPSTRPDSDPRAGHPSRLRYREIERARKKQHRHRVIAVVVLVVSALVVAGAVIRTLAASHASGTDSASLTAGTVSSAPGSGDPGSADPSPSQNGSPTAVPSVSGPPTNAPDVPDKGTGLYTYATGTGASIGQASAGLRRFRVAVENGSGVDVAAFTTAVEAILTDSHGWTAGGQVRFQRVAQTAQFDFTLYLATPTTADKLCAIGGLHTQKFLSCRLPGQVVINLARWLTAVPDYGAPLATYQQYAINHEVGRELGYANEACPGTGRPAPVMQQQSLGLGGCTANPWPYPQSTLYQGPTIP